PRVVDGGLAADGRIDLREQRGGYLHEVDAALIARGRVAREVADHAAAERDETRIAMEVRIDEPVEDDAERRQRLESLAVRQDQCLEVPAAQRGFDAGEVQRRYGLVRDDEDLARGGAVQRRVVEQTGAYVNGIAAVAQGHGDRFHAAKILRRGRVLQRAQQAAASRSRMSAATARTVRPVVSIFRSA